MHHLSRRFFVAAILPIVALAASGGAYAATNATPVPGKRVALRGYDPVSYFTSNGPEQGTAEFSFAFDDTVYLFKNAVHRALFAADPERYAPQYDSFCTMKLSRGEMGEADPEAWVIFDGRLFVFGAKRGATRFSENPALYIERANANVDLLTLP